MLAVEIRERTCPVSVEDRTEELLKTETLSSLLMISKLTRAFYGLKLAALGFHNGQDELLIALGNSPVSVTALAGQLAIRPSTVSKMLDRLVEKGVCERTSDKLDMRRTLVQITPVGIEVRKKLFELRQEVETELNRRLDADDRAAMRHVLAACSDHIARQLRRLR